MPTTFQRGTKPRFAVVLKNVSDDVGPCVPCGVSRKGACHALETGIDTRDHHRLSFAVGGLAGWSQRLTQWSGGLWQTAVASALAAKRASARRAPSDRPAAPSRLKPPELFAAASTIVTRV
jgi:hypothetical protein